MTAHLVHLFEGGLVLLMTCFQKLYTFLVWSRCLLFCSCHPLLMCDVRLCFDIHGIGSRNLNQVYIAFDAL